MHLRTNGFTLVEVVVVVLILGILAGVATPKLLDCAGTADEQAQRQTLAIIRDAIDIYTARSGELPGQTKKSDDFHDELSPYLRDEFPKSRFASNDNKAADVKIISKGDPLKDRVGGAHGWLYDNLTGEFIANSDDLSCDGVTLYSEF